MSVTLSLFAGAGAQFFDNNGNPLSGGKIYTYAAGTTTPNPTYTTNSDSSLHTNPIVLDAAGRVPSGGEIWLQLGVGYKFVVKTSAEVLIATYDNIPSSAQPPAANDADSIMYEQGYTVTAGSFVVGKIYRILTVGTTNFTLIGAVSNTIGTHFIATGVGTGTGTAQLSQTVETKLQEFISVKDFGAVGDNITDDSTAIQNALNWASSTGGNTVYVPAGTYFVNTTLTLPTNVVLRGAGRGNTILRGAGATMSATTAAVVGSGAGVIGIYMPGHNSEVVALTVKKFGCGIYMYQAFWSKVYLSRMTECRMGLRCNEGFITNIFENNMDYNKFNVVLQGQSYALAFYANDIDNQIQYVVGPNTVRAPGLFITGDNGAIVRDNVIESGSADVGSGIIIAGGINQRTVIAGNWFEQNGSTPYSCDIALGLPNNALGSALAASLPEEYGITAPSSTFANIDIHDNFHVASKYGIITTFFIDRLNIAIANETFVGVKGRFNQPITLFTNSDVSATTVDIKNCTVWNSQDNSIDSEMLSGVKNSYVFQGAGFTNTQYGKVTLDNVDLFTATMTTKEFLALPGATLNVTARRPTGGEARLLDGAVKSIQGTSGFKTIKGTDRVRLGASAVLTLDTPLVVSVLGYTIEGQAAAEYTYYSASGPGAIPVTDASGRWQIRTLTAVTNNEIYADTGSYIGLLVMSVANYNALSSIRQCVRLEITDIEVTDSNMTSAIIPTSYSSPAAYNWLQGDIVYNTAPAAGGNIGWVCTTSGSPGTWKAFGTIAA